MDYDATRPDNGSSNETESAMWEALLMTYALGAATDDEIAIVRARITSDPTAAQLAADYAAIAAVLPELLAEQESPTLAPPAALKDRVLDAARATRPQDPAPDATAAPEGPKTPLSLPPARRPRPRVWGSARVYLGWAVAAVLLIVCVTQFSVNASLRQQTANTRTIVWLASRSSHAYTMKGTMNAPTANAVLLESSMDGKVVLLTDGFPACGSGQVYRVWMRRLNGSYLAAMTFTGGKQEMFLVSGSLRGMQEVVITTEPRDQPAPAPSGTTVMEGALV